MSAADDDQIDLDEVLRLIMSRTGKTRRQAKADLLEKLRSGKLMSTGVNEATGRRETIPPEAWISKVH